MTVITSENILKKLAFSMFSGTNKARLMSLRSYLIKASKEHKASGLGTPSRQMIYKWFNGSIPQRGIAFSFIYSVARTYRKDETNYSVLSSEQKKVLNQVSNFCRDEKHGNKKENPIHGNANAGVVLRQDRMCPATEIANDTEHLIGIYNVYRSKFSTQNHEQPLSVEVLQISKVDTQLYVTWWFLIDESKLHKFDGSILFVGNNLWFILHNPSLGGRMRIFCVDRIGWGRVDNGYHTGVLLSTTPEYRDPNPAACRVLLEKVKSPSKFSRLKKFVYFSSEEEFKHKHKSHILKTINNKICLDNVLLANAELIKNL